MPAGTHPAIWLIVALGVAGLILRPWRLPEAVWAVAAALGLVAGGLLPWQAAWRAVQDGNDVYLFLGGMMLLSEVARREALFDYLAAHAVRRARGSARRLFLLIYAVGTLVTVFLSNDATAVVLTPAVLAATRAAGAEPLPFLFICAFVANAASFVLPISNPANLVLYAGHMPPLLAWLARFLLPSALSIGATLGVLLLVERRCLRQPIRTGITSPTLSGHGRVAACGIGLTALALMAASACGRDLGLPTALAGTVTAAAVLIRKREAPWAMLRGISWLVLPLVAGLFVLVAGLRETGALAALAARLHLAAQHAAPLTAGLAGGGIALLCNAVNNLPAGLIAGSAAASGDLPRPVTDALLIGVDLGPNLSLTGSLATILWLGVLRRDGVDCSAWRFLARGALVMPPALLLALAALALTMG